jgi:hypothetical protein
LLFFSELSSLEHPKIVRVVTNSIIIFFIILF